MFTPPPSPDPYRAKHNILPEPSPTDDDGFLTVPPSTLPSCLSKSASGEIEDLRHQRKLQTTRRIRWTILLVPAILILITVSTRYISHSTGLSAWPSERSNEWLHLKREPSPEPVPLPQQSSASASSTSSTTQAVPTVPATPPQLPTPFPQALDQSLSTNFSTQGCENFFLNMTSSTAFRTCRPFSLLFQTSSDFVLAQTNLTALNNIVWGTCNTNTDAGQCSENMAWFAQDLQQECAEDVKENNAVVMQTLKGLQTYDLYRTTAV
ncbi:hypothetical protein BC629DRAFT_1656668 [Irpex lacteus]|nr:hypothetical protein BC629DRAFT_1656668 [Irpex lacteus]